MRLCANSDFLREDSAIKDFEHPPFTLLGVADHEVEETLRKLYQKIPAPIFVLPPREALLVKYASNAFHALKVVLPMKSASFARR